MLTRRVREVFHAAWSVYRNPPGRVPRWRLEATSRGPRVRGTPLLLREIEANPFLLGELDLLVRLCERKAVTCQIAADGLQLGIDSLSLTIQTAEELYIVNEIFVNQCYNISLGQPFVLIDVGMNVGFASLWFANRPDVEAVYSYEPFPGTFQQGLRNIEANPIPGMKIRAFNFGLGLEDGQLDLPYDPVWKGKSSIRGLSGVWHKADNITSQPVRIQAAGATLTEILDRHEGTAIVAKIDCEGAEYEIIPALEKAEVLARFAAFAIEWHVEGPTSLLESLARHGFTATVSFEPEGPSIGMLYAFRGPKKR